MSLRSCLTSALTLAAAPFLPPAHVAELVANLVATLDDGHEPVRPSIQRAVTVRRAPRSEGALVLPEETDVEGLVEALIEATDDTAPRVCADCEGFGCDACEGDEEDEPDNEADMLEPFGDYDEPEPCDGYQEAW